MKLFSFIVSILMSFQMVQGAEPLARFSIDKAIYEGMSSTQQNALIQKTQEIGSFIEQTIRNKIPQSLSAQLSDLKIKISLTDKPGRDGLFTPQDSGEHVITIQLIQLQFNGIKALIAHEIFHAIHFHLNPDEFPWMREGMAQLFEFIATGELNGMNLRAAIADPTTPLLGSYDIEQTTRSQYGHNQLYFYYLYSHCGGDQTFWKLTAGQKENNLKGSFLIDSVLANLNSKASECSNFPESAIAFEVAKIHNQIQFLKAEEKDRYFILSSVISPVFEKINSADELKKTIISLPVLSSFKIPLADYIKFKGDCSNCALYYVDDGFPYSVSEKAPSKTANTSVIFVKLQKN